MNKKLLSVLLLLFFLFSSSCQQKKLAQGTSADIVWTNPKPYGIIDNLVPSMQSGQLSQRDGGVDSFKQDEKPLRIQCLEANIKEKKLSRKSIGYLCIVR